MNIREVKTANAFGCQHMGDFILYPNSLSLRSTGNIVFLL